MFLTGNPCVSVPVIGGNAITIALTYQCSCFCMMHLSRLSQLPFFLFFKNNKQMFILNNSAMLYTSFSLSVKEALSSSASFSFSVISWHCCWYCSRSSRRILLSSIKWFSLRSWGKMARWTWMSLIIKEKFKVNFNLQTRNVERHICSPGAHCRKGFMTRVVKSSIGACYQRVYSKEVGWLTWYGFVNGYG